MNTPFSIDACPPPRGLFVGLATLDLVYEVDHVPAANQKIHARSQQLYVGGPATNAAITFAHLGGEAALAAAVGRHPLATVLHQEFRSFGVRLADLAPAFDDLPSISSIAVDADAQRTVVSANAARIVAAAVEPDPELCRAAQIVLVDGHPMQACQRWAAAARGHGAHVVLDGGSWKQGTDALLACVDTAICSADFHPPGCATETETLAYLAATGVRQIAITHGAEPIVWCAGGERGQIAVPPVAAVDTMGAGDIFHGAFCHAYAQKADFRYALAAAARLAAHACRFHGTREWMHHALAPAES
jgi:sugar/nucleoside kinase (ribokinase family)